MSSSDQAALRTLRRRVKQLVDDVISPQLRRSESPVDLVVDLWEREAPGAVVPGENTNARFVRLAVNSHLTLVLIVDEIRDGTREELEAVLEDGRPELMVLSFQPPRATPDEKLAELDDYFRSIKERVLFRRCKGPNSSDAWIGLLTALTAFLVSALHSAQSRESVAPEVR